MEEIIIPYANCCQTTGKELIVYVNYSYLVNVIMLVIASYIDDGDQPRSCVLILFYVVF